MIISRRVKLISLLSFTFLLSSFGVAYASTTQIKVNGVTNSTIYKAGSNVDIRGTINGDVFCAGQTVNVDANINGDVICAAQTITLNGHVSGNVRLAGQTVNLAGIVDHNVSILAQSAYIESGSSTGNDLSLVAQTATIDSPVTRDISAAVSSLSLNNSVGRNVTTTVSNLSLNSNVKIGGNLNYTSSNKLVKSSSTIISGKTIFNVPKKSSSYSNSAWSFNLYLIIVLIITAIILVSLFPQVFVKLQKIGSKKVWQSLLIGFAAMFLVPATIIILFITIIGFPLAVFSFLTWTLINMLAPFLFAFYIGKLIISSQKSALLVNLTGAVVLGILSLIPVIGVLIMLLAVWYGTGTIILYFINSYKKPNYKT